MLHTDIVASDIPLLLSRKPINRADMNLDFKQNQPVIFSEPTKLIMTKSGYHPNKSAKGNTESCNNRK